MKDIQQWLDEYGESHQNPMNKKIHWVCVPLIMISLLALISLIPFPSFIKFTGNSIIDSWGTVFLLYCVIFYLRMSVSIAVGMLIIAFFMIWGINWLDSFEISLWMLSLFIFILAWIGQFIGHKIEGKKPSFFEDLQFLLIGPAWLLSFIYKKMNIKY
tara:strand:- start:164 stop:637 length:474 start_codon:yes stop_codon:yes gene_type:complete